MSRPQNSFQTLPQPPKIAHQGPKKYKMTPKLSQNQRSELKETQKMKVIQLPEQTPKQFLNPFPDPKNSPLGPKKVKNDPKIKSKSKTFIFYVSNSSESYCGHSYSVLYFPVRLFDHENYNILSFDIPQIVSPIHPHYNFLNTLNLTLIHSHHDEGLSRSHFHSH